MSELNHFSASTLAELQKDEKHPYYVYCLVDPRNNQTFYIGKGKGNRIFAHRQAALNMLRKSDLLEENETVRTLKIKTIQEINGMKLKISSYILSYGLTESEAYASENALINYAQLIQGLSLTNLVKGHGSKAMSVEEIEDRYGFQPMSINEIATNELILAVKVRDAFNLSKDESQEYPIDDRFRDDNNLKSRTLGNWVIGRDKIHRIRYVIAVNTGADNAVVAAYKVSSRYSESKKFENGLTRYAFQALSNRDDTLRELNLYKRSLPEIKFGSGSAVAYINN
ncbi:hypothetical protein EFL14_RS13025 [Enterococcus hirae]|uniref:LEM-3-like GIY-YIG domain-containing protein n=1 Tax=Enterococcus sp. C63 TaxID=3231324 RepID=UPI001A01E487|nr:hypothetical protein [Enterococcus hirae]EMF0130939.1 hypothetical protein [Enterococcus hirae]EMF0449978.1 hypothetical protein [Enterococcus hirae]EMF0517400.1 hypothetical protein [Enterococcus hirae]EMF0518740.1 hypothetical protein [Enterococcus hirae]